MCVGIGVLGGLGYCLVKDEVLAHLLYICGRIPWLLRNLPCLTSGCVCFQALRSSGRRTRHRQGLKPRLGYHIVLQFSARKPLPRTPTPSRSAAPQSPPNPTRPPSTPYATRCIIGTAIPRTLPITTRIRAPPIATGQPPSSRPPSPSTSRSRGTRRRRPPHFLLLGPPPHFLPPSFLLRRPPLSSQLPRLLFGL